MVKQRFRFGFIYLAQITQCPEIVWVRKKMPSPWTDCRHPVDLPSVWVKNGISKTVWDKLCFKTAVHLGQKAVKMFTGFDTISCQGRGGRTSWGSLEVPPLEGIIQPSVTTHIAAHEMCAGSQPESTLHLAGCQKTNEQILPLSGCPLPSPYTCS